MLSPGDLCVFVGESKTLFVKNTNSLISAKGIFIFIKNHNDPDFDFDVDICDLIDVKSQQIVDCVKISCIRKI